MASRSVRWAIAPATALVLLLAGVGGTAGAAMPPRLAPEPVVLFGPSDADVVALLAGTFYVNPTQASRVPFWWDHPNLTAAVQSGPTTDRTDVQAARDAIALWGSVLADRLPEISLTDVTSGLRGSSGADIVIHLVPHSGGMKFGGSAVCGIQKCLNVLVKTDMPAGHLAKGEPDIIDFDPLRVERETMHELGHALGLGHAAPLEQSVDLMGYGWAVPDPDVTPVLSDCDLRGIRIAFGWVFDHEPPHPSPVQSLTC